MAKSKRYPAEVRERAVRLVLEHRGEYATEWAAITSVAEKCGMTVETLRKWVRRAEVDSGRRPGVTSEEAQRIKELERENRELRRANEMADSSQTLHQPNGALLAHYCGRHRQHVVLCVDRPHAST